MKFSPRLMLPLPILIICLPRLTMKEPDKASLSCHEGVAYRDSPDRTNQAKGAAEAPTSTAPGHRTRARILALVTGSYATSPARSCKDPHSYGLSDTYRQPV